MDGENAKLMPMDNVYSYFMFLGPIERKKDPTRISWNKILAWLLVVLNIFLQTTVLYAVFTTVVTSDVIWRNSIISLAGNSVNPFAPEPSKCNPGGSLCSETNGTFSCAPPSIQLAGRWDMLDLDNDGIWTREEVLEKREELQCQFAVDPLEVFNVFVSFVKKRKDVIWVHPLVQSGKALHKAYFDFAKGDIIMCNYRNDEMCPNLLQRGFFDGPLTTGKSPRVGKTIESALNYCYDLLKTGGVCERSLPSTYSVWRKSSDNQCFDELYHKFIYKHPKTGQTKSLLEVDYKAVSDYEKGRNSYLFMTYKSIIILMFVLCMFVELKDIILVFSWVLTFPSEEQVEAQGEDAVHEEHDADGKVSKYIIHGITKQHRMLVGVITLTRFVLGIFLTWVGTVFLLMDTDYVNLLLNGVGLIFVIEIANCLYGQLLDLELREQCENSDPFSVSMGFMWKICWFKNPAVRDLMHLVIILAVLIGGMYLHYIHIARPLSTALECTCLTRGDKCYEAQAFDKSFWEGYWANTVPEVFASVEHMKKEHEDDDDDSDVSDVTEDAPAPAPAAAPTNFIHKGLHGKAHHFTTLKGPGVIPFQHGHAHHKSRHRVTRLLNAHD